ncbi:protein POLYCHOME-like, partial [Lotus japonicus]|uniref:protein POLYCHOME-like n=1 Tax=Lotus japonicus TaxID=34305 RepID=UPI002589D680
IAILVISRKCAVNKTLQIPTLRSSDPALPTHVRTKRPPRYASQPRRSPFGFSPTATLAPGPENSTPWATVPRGRRRAQSRSVLPVWYPRTPLRDLTVLVRSMERRGIQNSEEGQRTPLDRSVVEHRCCDDSSSVSVKIRTPAGSKVPKIVLNFADEEEGELELLTPQKKLLDSIDMVEKLVRESLQKLKQSPSGRKAEREKRVRTLMSMR